MRKLTKASIIGVFLLFTSATFSQVTITPASATNLCPTDISYTSIGNINFLETNVNDIDSSGTGSNIDTLTFVLPSGFEFNPTMTVGMTVNSGSDISTFTELFVGVDSAAFTYTVEDIVSTDDFDLTGIEIKAITPGASGNLMINGIDVNLNGNPTVLATLGTVSLPTISTANTPEDICDGTAFTTVNLTSGDGGDGFLWGVKETTNINNSTSGADNTIDAQTLNLIDDTQDGILTYFAIASVGGCQGIDTTDFTINISAVPSLTNSPTNFTVCWGESTGGLTLTSDVSGAVFDWSHDQGSVDISGASNPTGTNSTQLPDETLYTTGGANLTYTITPKNNGCLGSNATIIYTVGEQITATPALTNGTENNAIVVCDADNITYEVNSTLNNLTWELLHGNANFASAPSNGDKIVTVNHGTANDTLVVRQGIPGCQDSTAFPIEVFGCTIEGLSSNVCEGDQLTLNIGTLPAAFDDGLASLQWSVNGNGTIVGNDNETSVVVAITNSTGTLDVDFQASYNGSANYNAPTAQGTINTLPSRVTISGPSNVMCGEQDVTFNASASADFEWRVYSASNFVGETFNSSSSNSAQLDFNQNVSTAYVSVQEVNASGCKLAEAGQGIRVDGTYNDALNIQKDVTPANAVMNAALGSVTFWVKFDNVTNPQVIYYGTDQDGNNNGTYRQNGFLNGYNELTVGIIDQRFRFTITNGSNGAGLMDIEESDITVQANTWYYVAATWNEAGQMKLYVNDDSDIESRNHDNGATYSFSKRNRIGRARIADSGSPENSFTFGGYIDNISLWSKELSAAEVMKYKEQQIYPQTDLVAYYPFDPEDTYSDASGNGLTISGEGYTPTFGASDFYSDVTEVTIDNFSFSLDVVDNSNPSTPNGSLTFNVGSKVFNIANDESGFNWEPNDSFDGNNAATGLNTGTNLTLTVTNSAGCSDSETETVGGQSNVAGGNIEFSTTSAANYSVCQDSLVPAINNTVSPSGGDGSYTYSWYRSENGGPFLPIGGQNQIDLNLNAPPNNTAVFTSIKRITTDGNANTAESNTLTFFRIGRTALTIDIDTTVFGIVNQEYYCESDAAVDLKVNAGGGAGYFLDGTDDPQYSYVLDAKGSNPQVDMSSANAGAFREVVYINYDLAPDRCPNYDTTRFAIIPNVDNDFVLTPNQTTADLNQQLLPSPWTTDLDNFECTDCPGFQPFTQGFGDTLEFAPSAFTGNEGGPYTIRYTHTVDSSGTNIVCHNVHEKNVNVTQGIARFENIGSEVCSSQGYITFTVDAGAGNIALDVYGRYHKDYVLPSDPYDFIVSTTPFDGGQKMSVVIDPSKLPWDYYLQNFPTVGQNYFLGTYTYDFIIFEFMNNTGTPFVDNIQRRVEVITTPYPYITGLDLEYCVNETDISFGVSPAKSAANYSGSFTSAEGTGEVLTSLSGSGRLTGGDTYNPNELFGTANALDAETITYRYTVKNTSTNATICVIDSSYDITIKDSPLLEITNLHPSNHYCKNDTSGVLRGSPVGGVFLSDITTGQGAYNPANIDIGDHIIEYAYTSQASQCSDTLTVIITMDTVPEIGISVSDMIFCEDQDTLIIKGFVGEVAPYSFNESNGVIYGNGVIEEDDTRSIAFFDAAASGAQDEYVTIYYDYTDGNGCSNLDSTEVYVRTLPDLSIDAFEFETSTPFISDVCQEIETVRFIGKNSNPNDLQTGETPPDYGWKVNGFIEGGDLDTLDYGISSFVDNNMTVEYTYTDRYGCISNVSNDYFVHASPTANFQEESNCIVDTITFTDLSTTVAGSPDDGILSWSWNFGDFAIVGGGTSTVQSPKHKYNNPAVITSTFYPVQLAVSSQYGCVDTISKQVEIGADPVVDFSWVNDCIGLGNGTFFTNNTSPFETLPGKFTTMHWDFDDGTEITTFGNVQKNIKHAYVDDTTFNIQVIATSPLGCDDSLSKTITTRQYIKLDPDTVHDASFENGDLSGWFIDTSSVGAVNNAWAIGQIPSNKGGMSSLSNGTSAFYTYAAYPDGTYINSSQSFVKSGCFDLRNLDKPMIKLDYYADMQGLDGAVVQVSVDTGATWQNLGNYDGATSTGSNWYNSTLVAAKPGGISEQGWTLESKDEGIDSWLEARHTLNVNGYTDSSVVRFRIAFASNETNSREGFAFDNIWIGNRTRLILAEHFYNITSTNTSVIEDIWDIMFERSSPLDMIDIGYPTNVFASGVLNRDAVGQKEVDYAYPNTSGPYTVVDGNFQSEPGATWVGTESQRRLDNRALVDSPVLISSDPEPTKFGNDSLFINITISAIDSLDREDVRLKGAIVESEIDNFNPNGNNSLRLRNVMKNVLGKITGYPILPMNPDEDTTVTIYGNYSLVTDDSKMGLVIYLQDEDTKEVLQAHYVGTNAGSYVVSLQDRISGNEYKYILFPNPAVNQTHLVFDTELKDDYDVTLVDNLGNVVDILTMEAGSKSLNINTSSYSSGLYILYISNGEQVLGVDKLVIQK